METILWHDYETFGAKPSVDRPSQFAGIRTDLELNIVGEPIELYCCVADDYLPQPEACLITGITPQQANREGYVEAEFIEIINREFSKPLTCVAGYNSLRFDDEVTRFTLYRNFFDPYSREWQNGNSRWDIIDLVRLVYAVRPECIVWPIREDGSPSFRLEELTVSNGIIHESAHDAISDVYATIAVAKLIKTACPDLYNLAFSMKDKRHVKSLIDIANNKPLFHVSSRFPANLGCCAVIVPLAEHPINKNGFITFDLREDPTELISFSVEEIKQRVFVSNEELAEKGYARIPLKVVHANKCPILSPMSLTKSIDSKHMEKHQLDGATLRKHLSQIRQSQTLSDKVQQVFSSNEHHADSQSDPELMLYSGGFFGQHDKQLMAEIVSLEKDQIGCFKPDFHDERLPELFFRYVARNYPHQLDEEEHERWEAFRMKRLVEGDESHLSLKEFMEKVVSLSGEENQSKRNLVILEDLKLYAESIMPYC